MDTETSRVGKLLADQAEEIVKLKQQNAELLKALKYYACECKNNDCDDVARVVIRKVTGGK